MPLKKGRTIKESCKLTCHCAARHFLGTHGARQFSAVETPAFFQRGAGRKSTAARNSSRRVICCRNYCTNGRVITPSDFSRSIANSRPAEFSLRAVDSIRNIVNVCLWRNLSLFCSLQLVSGPKFGYAIKYNSCG